jgi:hypothetical protein
MRLVGEFRRELIPARRAKRRGGEEEYEDGLVRREELD